LVVLGVFAAAPAGAGAQPTTHRPAASAKHWVNPDQSACGGRKRGCASSDPVVNFRRNALFTCFGAFGGIPTADFANITSTFFTITATVTVFAPPGTAVFGQLVQSGCVRFKFFSFVVGPTGVGTTTVTDLRVSRDAFVFINTSNGQFEITPEVFV
jgi:hypothetical protein